MSLIKRNHKILLKTIFLLIFTNIILANTYCVLGGNLILNRGNTMPTTLKLEIELDKHVYKIEEPITIKCNITNVGENTITLCPILFNDVEVYLKYENEKEFVSFGPKILLKELIRKEDIIKIESKKSHPYIRRIDEKAYVMPNKHGRYEIYVVYSNLMKDLEKIKLWTGELKSNIVKFEIINK